MTAFKAKMHQIRFRRHRWGAYSAPPGHLAGCGAASRQGEGLGWGGGGKGEGNGREGEVEGGKEGPKATVELGPLRALLRHCYDDKSRSVQDGKNIYMAGAIFRLHLLPLLTLATNHENNNINLDPIVRKSAVYIVSLRLREYMHSRYFGKFHHNSNPNKPNQ